MVFKWIRRGGSWDTIRWLRMPLYRVCVNPGMRANPQLGAHGKIACSLRRGSSPGAAARHSQSARGYTDSRRKYFFQICLGGAFWGNFDTFKKIGLSRLNPILNPQKKGLRRFNPNYCGRNRVETAQSNFSKISRAKHVRSVNLRWY